MLRTALTLSALAALVACDGTDPANAVTGSKRTGEVAAAKLQLKGLADGIRAIELSQGDYPMSLDVMVAEGSIRESDLDDPWGNEYVYYPPDAGEKPTLFSKGRDGEAETNDDVVHEWQ